MYLSIDLNLVRALGCSETVLLGIIQKSFKEFPNDVKIIEKEKFVKCSKSFLRKQLNYSRFQVNSCINSLIKQNIIKIMFIGDKKSMHVCINEQMVINSMFTHLAKFNNL